MYNVAIIGAGQLGSRHLQGLKLASSPLNITVMDSNGESLKVANERYETVLPIGEKTVAFVTKLEDLPLQLDLVIVATGSKPRASIVKSLIAHTTVKYLILEKVLFPVLDEYYEIETLLKEKKVKCWVNCTRRMFGMYKQIKDLINPMKSISMVNANENWGLCCNAIHMIDIFMYLTGSSSYSIDVSGLDNKIEDSKRGGYIEMTGTIGIQTPQGHKLTLVSENDYKGEKGITIKNGDNTFFVSETTGLWLYNGVSDEFRIPFQSQLTGVLADELLITGGCSLTPFAMSASYHKPFIEALLSKYNFIINISENKILPIT